ncbi:MAG: DUF3276 family protein [Rikenellaceae bacterium]
MEKIYDVTEKKVTFDKALYTKIVWAGRRRYFFDILSTRAGDKYISITESRKKQDQNGGIQFENQKLFIFKEDFEKFTDALTDVLEQLKVLKEPSVGSENCEEAIFNKNFTTPYEEYKVVDLEFENL